MYVIDDFFISLAASAALAAIELGKNNVDEKEKQNLIKLHSDIKNNRSAKGEIDIVFASSLKSLSSDEQIGKNKDLLFNDQQFKKLIKRWVFTLDVDKKEQEKVLLTERVNHLLGKDIGLPTINALLEAFEKSLLKNHFLSQITTRQDSQQIFNAINELKELLPAEVVKQKVLSNGEIEKYFRVKCSEYLQKQVNYYPLKGIALGVG